MVLTTRSCTPLVIDGKLSPEGLERAAVAGIDGNDFAFAKAFFGAGKPVAA